MQLLPAAMRWTNCSKSFTVRAVVRTGLESVRAQTVQLNTTTHGLLNAAKLVGAGRAAGA